VPYDSGFARPGISRGSTESHRPDMWLAYNRQLRVPSLEMNEMPTVRFLKARRYELLGVVLFLLLASALVITTTSLHRADGGHRVSMVMEDETHAATMRHDALSSAIRSAVSDILFLRELNELAAFLSNPSELASDALAKELVSFTRTRDIYDQIRVLSLDGMEIVRVDRGDGSPYVIAESKLQYKGDRGYFQEMLALRSDTVYISQLDLNIENGDVEQPLKPMLRFGVRLGTYESPQGYLVLNMLGATLLDAYEAAHPNAFSEAYLLKGSGYWLRGPTRELEWGFVVPSRADEGFQFSFPEEWKKIRSERVGQFETEKGLFTFDIVVPSEVTGISVGAPGDSVPAGGSAGADSSFPPYEWRSVSVVPPTILHAIRSAGVARVVGWNVVGVLALAIGAFLLTQRLRIRAAAHARANREKELLATTLEKYMHKEIRDRLLADPSRHARLGGESQDVAVLFADIRGFTRFTETNDPEYVVSVLNRTLTELAVPLRIFDGILDKYIGDGFLAFFESKPDAADAAQRAIDAARMMQTAFRNLWHDAPSSDLRELGLGIGISTGRVVVGNVGSEKSMDYTVVGDAVNIAARLEGMAKPGETLLCGAVRSRLQSDPHVALARRSGKLRGRGEPLDIYKLV